MTDVYEDRGMDKKEAPKNNLPDWSECRLRVENSRWLKSENRTPEDDSRVANPLHEFIYEYDDTDKHKSSWWMHRLELLIDCIREESTAPLIAEIEKLRAYINDPGYVRVPVEQLQKLDKGRCDLWDFLESQLSEFELSKFYRSTLHAITIQMWKVANTKCWDKAMLSASEGQQK